mmetsp:Transcript_13217/g.38980  ORF Transcript_13217/g.38980 Transcript_13217/m.38980 type:complete len:101 (+) Transcript_13217:126-428(+)
MDGGTRHSGRSRSTKSPGSHSVERLCEQCSRGCTALGSSPPMVDATHIAHNNRNQAHWPRINMPSSGAGCHRNCGIRPAVQCMHGRVGIYCLLASFELCE